MENNPHIGPRCFDVGDRDHFFGREEEIGLLSGQVLAHRTVLLFAISGAGKSSVLRAGLIPHLTERRAVRRGRFSRTLQKAAVLPVLTVGGSVADEVDQQRIDNIFIFNALCKLLAEENPAELLQLDLCAGLERFCAGRQEPPADQLLENRRRQPDSNW